MPGIDGIEATRRIREFNKDIIIIAQSGFVFEEDKLKALNAGCTNYIPKPFKGNKMNLQETFSSAV